MTMAKDMKASESPREIIEKIRRIEFGIGADLQGDGEVVVEALVRKYRSLLETVAQDLNSKESHFLLELVQNADDNEYAEGVAPTLAFWLTPEELVAFNNELGFLEKNVRALCSAGESSKKNKVGYIGEKGIGFKSVFKVTDSPEIHSNGYHFKFDITNPEDSLGYVVPHWVPGREDANQGGTTVVLPARPGHLFAPTLLNDISPTLLLFLAKLRDVQIELSSGSSRFTRDDADSVSTLTVTTNTGDGHESSEVTTYLRTRFGLDMSKIVEPKRENVAQAEIVLAFPMDEDGAAKPAEGCQTYAFLPIREFGFKFYIQADFVLISSREGIHEELPWNVRLRDEISRAFAAAVKRFKTHPGLAKTFLRFLPGDRDVVDPFFAPVVEQTIRALKGIQCIPVEGGEWRKPGDVLLVPGAFRKLFTSDDAAALFGGAYPLPEIAVPDGGLARLSCRSLLVEDVLGLFKTRGEWLLAKDLEWKVRFYEYLAKSGSRKDFLAGMLKLPCVPVSSGGMANPEDGIVFFPLKADSNYGFEHMLTVVDQAFYARAREVAPGVLMLLRDLGVKHDEPYELIQEHVIPHHTLDGLKVADSGSLIGHIRYLRDKLDLYLAKSRERGLETHALQELREGLYLASKREESGTLYFDRPDGLYISKTYRPSFDIETLLGESIAPARLISDVYVVKPSDAADAEAELKDIERWRTFFARIGVHQVPKVVREQSGEVSCSVELSALLQSGDQGVRRLTLECLSKNWGMYGIPTYVARNGRGLQKTQVVRALQATIAPTKRRVSAPLEQTYHDRPDIREVLTGNVVFVDATFTDDRFLDACGITYKVNAEACLKRLRQIRKDGGSTKEAVRAIYRQLERLWSSDHSTIEATFRAERLIAVGRGEDTTWVLPSEACWRPSNIRLLDRRHPPLSSQYVDFSNFFTKLLKVPSELAIEKWLDAIKDLESMESASDRQATAVAIYRRLHQALATQAVANPPVFAWISRLKDEEIYLTQAGDLVESSPTLYFNDAPQYAALFQDAPEVQFLAVAPEQLPAISQLLGKAGIHTLTAALKVEVSDDVQGVRDEQLMLKVRSMFMCIVRVVYGQSNERFHTAIKAKLFEALRDLEILIVPGLLLDLTLGTASRETAGAVARRGTELLLDAEAPSRLDHVAIEVQKLLRLPAASVDIISRLLISPTVREAEAYLQLRQISSLPPEEALALSRALGLAEPEPEPAPDVEKEAVHARESESSAPPAPMAEQAEHAVEPGSSPTVTTFPVSVPPAAEVQPTSPTPTLVSPPEPEEAATAVCGPTPWPAWSGAPLPTGGGLQGGTEWSRPSGVPLASPPTLGDFQPAGPQQAEAPADASAGAVPGVFAPARIGWGLQVGLPRARRSSRGSGSKRSGRGRLLSYAEKPDRTVPPVAPLEAPDPEAAARNRAVELAAVKLFMEQAAPQWRSVEIMPPNNPG
ncbi:sacsin N-terminal ATP-binding-like domain-containing protein [Delftia acidovorans]